MTKRCWAWAVICGLLACVSAWAQTQCVSGLVTVSAPVSFPNREAGPDAWTGALLGVTKLDSDRSTNAIWLGVYDGNLNPAIPDRLVVPTSANGPLALVWNGSDFGLFYQQPATLQLMMQRVSIGTVPIGNPVAIAPGHALAGGQEFNFTWDATRSAYVIARSSLSGFERGLWLTTAGVDGTTKTNDQLTFNVFDTATPRVAVTSSGVIAVTWARVINNQEELAFAIVVPGQPLTNIATVAQNATHALMATDNRIFFEVYQSPAPGNTTEIRASKFDTTGRVVAADSRLVAPSGVDAVPASFIATDREWALEYVDAIFGAQSTFPGDTRLLRIPFDTSLPQSNTLFSPDVTKRSLAPTGTIAWTGTFYTGPIGRYLSQAEGSESYLVRDCPLVATAVATPRIALPNATVTFTATATGGTGGPYSYSWQFGDISTAEQGQTRTHVFARVGTYTATVTVTDAYGAVAVSRFTVQVANPKHRAAGK